MKQSLWAEIKPAEPKSTCLYIVHIKHEVCSVKTGRNRAGVSRKCLLLLSESKWPLLSVFYGSYRMMWMNVICFHIGMKTLSSCLMFHVSTSFRPTGLLGWMVKNGWGNLKFWECDGFQMPTWTELIPLLLICFACLLTLSFVFVFIIRTII